MRGRLIAFTTILLLNSIASLGQDTVIEIPYLVAREIAADLLRYDSALVELEVCDTRIQYLNDVILTKDEIIGLYAENSRDWEKIEAEYIKEVQACNERTKTALKQRNLIAGASILVIILLIL